MPFEIRTIPPWTTWISKVFSVWALNVQHFLAGTATLYLEGWTYLPTRFPWVFHILRLSASCTPSFLFRSNATDKLRECVSKRLYEVEAQSRRCRSRVWAHEPELARRRCSCTFEIAENAKKWNVMPLIRRWSNFCFFSAIYFSCLEFNTLFVLLSWNYCLLAFLT